MTERKYRTVAVPHSKYHRLVAMRDFSNVKSGDEGGLVEGAGNLSHAGNCWIDYDSACIENGRVAGNSKIIEGSVVRGDASVDGDSIISDFSEISGVAVVESSEMADAEVSDGFFGPHSAKSNVKANEGWVRRRRCKG